MITTAEWELPGNEREMWHDVMLKHLAYYNLHWLVWLLHIARAVLCLISTKYQPHAIASTLYTAVYATNPFLPSYSRIGRIEWIRQHQKSRGVYVKYGQKSRIFQYRTTPKLRNVDWEHRAGRSSAPSKLLLLLFLFAPSLSIDRRVSATLHSTDNTFS